MPIELRAKTTVSHEVTKSMGLICLVRNSRTSPCVALLKTKKILVSAVLSLPAPGFSRLATPKKLIQPVAPPPRLAKVRSSF